MNVRTYEFGQWFAITGFAATGLMVWLIVRPSTPPEAASGPDLMSADVAGPARPAAGRFQAGARHPLQGQWLGRISVGQAARELRFDLKEDDGRLHGTVDFPTGRGIVETGTVLNDAVTLVTRSPLQATGQQLQTRFTGTVTGDTLQLMMKTDQGDVNLELRRAL